MDDPTVPCLDDRSPALLADAVGAERSPAAAVADPASRIRITGLRATWVNPVVFLRIETNHGVVGWGETPDDWRTAAHWEYDWRGYLLRLLPERPVWDRTLDRQNLAVLRSSTHAYVQFGDGQWLCFDLAADPTWRTTTDDPVVVLPLAQAMLQWRAEHADRTLTDMLCEDGGVGRLPAVSWA